MKKIVILFSVFLLIFSVSLISAEENKERYTKIIISGYGKDCDTALSDAYRQCNERKGEVTFVGICSEIPDNPADSRYKQDVYCKIKY